MFIIQANNIHEGGGKTLLKSFLTSFNERKSNEKAVVFLDQRFDSETVNELLKNKNLTIHYVRPSLVSRFNSEIAIWKLAKKYESSTLLCFGNLPPLFPSKSRVVLFYQSVLYFEEFNRFISGLRLKIKLSIERLWIQSRLNLVDEILVQSTFMKENLCKQFEYPENQITIQPFSDLKNLKSHASQSEVSTREGFFYPAIGTPHKNHKTLIDAWVILAKSNIFPLLILTLDTRFLDTLDHLESAQKNHNIRFKNLGLISREEVLSQLVTSQAMIFPSLCESFGLPLLEAKENNIQIIAGELDFVRDLLNPIETFNPESALSIARAVKRFLKIDEDHLTISSPDIFVSQVLKIVKRDLF